MHDHPEDWNMEPGKREEEARRKRRGIYINAVIGRGGWREYGAHTPRNIKVRLARG